MLEQRGWFAGVYCWNRCVGTELGVERSTYVYPQSFTIGQLTNASQSARFLLVERVLSRISSSVSATSGRLKAYGNSGQSSIY